MISLKEFKDELELMEKQYGAEEELYSWIYMLLREAGYTQKYSVRSVAGASSADKNEDEKVKNRCLFRGYAAFPDIAIINKTFLEKNENETKYTIEDEIKKLYCCVEAKKINETLLDIEGEIKISSGRSLCIQSSGNRPKHLYYKPIDCNDSDNNIIEKYKIENIKSTSNAEQERNYYNDNVIINDDKKREELKSIITNISEKDWDYMYSDKKTKNIDAILNQSVFYLLINKNYAIATINKVQKKSLIDIRMKATDYGELIGELLWYGRVIYTNGYEWKYLTIKDFDKILGECRNKFYKDCVEKNNNHLWCNKFKDTSFEVIVEDLITIDNTKTESDWEDFKTKLREISKDWYKPCETPTNK